MVEQAFKWWEEQDPEYREHLPKWCYTATVYGADPDKLREKGRFLVMKRQGEHEQNYEERCELASFVPLFAAVVDAYVGRIQEAEKKIERRWNRTTGEGEAATTEEGLGDEKDLATLAGRLWHNADGRGLNYLPMLSQVAVTLTTKRLVWGLVEGVRRDAAGQVIGDPSIRVIEPDAVPLTVEDEAGNLVQAVVHHTVTVRPSVYEPGEVRDRYTVYSLDGFAVFEIRDREVGTGAQKQTIQEAVRVDGGAGMDPLPYGGTAQAQFYYYDTADRNMSDRILPIFRVDLPTKRHPGYTLAQQNVAYFNTYSELQNKHRTCNIMKLQVPYMDTDDKGEKGADLAGGSTVIWISPDSNRDVQWIEPDASSLAETREWLGVMRSDFMFSALRGYEDSARGGQKTATEAAQDSAQGEHSYLNMLAGALDEFEMQAWKRIEQIEWPGDPKRWGQFYVRRRRDFRPLDEEGEAGRLHKTFFGETEPVPVGNSGRVAAAKRIADLSEIEADLSEIKRDVEVRFGEAEVRVERARVGLEADRAAMALSPQQAAREREIEEAARQNGNGQ